MLTLCYKINGNRITPSVEYAIGKGDIISIGGANRLERSTASCDEKRVEFGLHPWIINSVSLFALALVHDI